jgi:hypothetical protein
MEFARKKLRGQNQKVRRTWMSEEGYRIIWRKEAWGIEIPPGFQATVKIAMPSGEMWDFVGRHLFKTMKAAQEACQKHQRLWTKAIEASGIRALQELFGKVPLGYPLWVKSKLNRNVYALLMDTTTRKRKDYDLCETSPDDHTKTSDCSVGTREVMPEDLSPVLPVVEEDTPSIPRTEGSLTLGRKAPAKPAKAPAKARKKRAAPPTSKPSKRISKKKSSTSGGPIVEAAPSKNSPKKKSKRSRN